MTAQEADDETTTEVLAEVPSTGASRLGPVVLARTLVRGPVPEPEVAVVAGVAPIALQVDKFGIDAPIEFGAVVDGIMVDPSGPWVVSWYEGLGKIGEGGNVVMAGHVDYYTVGPAVFWNVRDLVPGDIVRVVGENGENFEYAVEWMQQYNVLTDLTPEVIQNDIVGDTGQESLTLITCGGDFDPTTATYNQRWVLRANLI
ncbi:MAG: class F sortase [Chloroflexia bacterium]|nr:class F sortase [Chloroflexia bacterium]